MPIHIMPLNTSMRIPKQYLNTFLTTEILLVGFLNPLLSYIVATDIIVIIFNIPHRNFSNIPQSMSSRVIGILPDRASLNIKTGELKQLFLKYATLFCRQLRHKQLIGISRVSRIPPTVFHISHDFQKLLPSDIQCLA